MSYLKAPKICSVNIALSSCSFNFIPFHCVCLTHSLLAIVPITPVRFCLCCTQPTGEGSLYIFQLWPTKPFLYQSVIQRRKTDVANKRCIFPFYLQYTTRELLDKKCESLAWVPQKTWNRHFTVNYLPREICEIFWALLIVLGSRGIGILNPRFIIEWHARCFAWGISREICLEWHLRGTVHFDVSCTLYATC